MFGVIPLFFFEFSHFSKYTFSSCGMLAATLTLSNLSVREIVHTHTHFNYVYYTLRTQDQIQVLLDLKLL